MELSEIFDESWGWRQADTRGAEHAARLGPVCLAKTFNPWSPMVDALAATPIQVLVGRGVIRRTLSSLAPFLPNQSPSLYPQPREDDYGIDL